MLPAKAIITSTKSGDTAQVCASYRGKTPIIALSASMRIVRELSLCYGVYAERIDIPPTTDELVKNSLKKLLAEGHFEKDDIIVFIGGGQIYSAHTNFLQVDTPATLLRNAQA
jgi:pyruvate kinase